MSDIWFIPYNNMKYYKFMNLYIEMRTDKF